MSKESPDHPENPSALKNEDNTDEGIDIGIPGATPNTVDQEELEEEEEEEEHEDSDDEFFDATSGDKEELEEDPGVSISSTPYQEMLEEERGDELDEVEEVDTSSQPNGDEEDDETFYDARTLEEDIEPETQSPSVTDGEDQPTSLDQEVESVDGESTTLSEPEADDTSLDDRDSSEDDDAERESEPEADEEVGNEPEAEEEFKDWDESQITTGIDDQLKEQALQVTEPLQELQRNAEYQTLINALEAKSDQLYFLIQSDPNKEIKYSIGGINYSSHFIHLIARSPNAKDILPHLGKNIAKRIDFQAIDSQGSSPIHIAIDTSLENFEAIIRSASLYKKVEEALGLDRPNMQDRILSHLITNYPDISAKELNRYIYVMLHSSTDLSREWIAYKASQENNFELLLETAQRGGITQKMVTTFISILQNNTPTQSQLSDMISLINNLSEHTQTTELCKEWITSRAIELNKPELIAKLYNGNITSDYSLEVVAKYAATHPNFELQTLLDKTPYQRFTKQIENGMKLINLIEANNHGRELLTNRYHSSEVTTPPLHQSGHQATTETTLPIFISEERHEGPISHEPIQVYQHKASKNVSNLQSQPEDKSRATRKAEWEQKKAEKKAKIARESEEIKEARRKEELDQKKRNDELLAQLKVKLAKEAVINELKTQFSISTSSELETRSAYNIQAEESHVIPPTVAHAPEILVTATPRTDKASEVISPPAPPTYTRFDPSRITPASPFKSTDAPETDDTTTPQIVTSDIPLTTQHILQTNDIGRIKRHLQNIDLNTLGERNSQSIYTLIDQTFIDPAQQSQKLQCYAIVALNHPEITSNQEQKKVIKQAYKHLADTIVAKIKNASNPSASQIFQTEISPYLSISNSQQQQINTELAKVDKKMTQINNMQKCKNIADELRSVFTKLYYAVTRFNFEPIKAVTQEMSNIVASQIAKQQPQRSSPQRRT